MWKGILEGDTLPSNGKGTQEYIDNLISNNKSLTNYINYEFFYLVELGFKDWGEKN